MIAPVHQSGDRFTRTSSGEAHQKQVWVLDKRRTPNTLEQPQQRMVIARQFHAGGPHGAERLHRSGGNLRVQPVKIVFVNPGLQLSRAPQAQGIRTRMHMGARDNQVGDLRCLRLHLPANFQYVVVEKSDDIHRAQRHGIHSCAQRQAARVKVIMDSSGYAVVSEPGEVDCVLVDVGRDHSFGHSGAQLRLGAGNEGGHG